MTYSQQTSYDLLVGQAREKELQSAEKEERARHADSLPIMYELYIEAAELITAAASLRMKAVLDLRMRENEDLGTISIMHEQKRIGLLNFQKSHELYITLDHAIRDHKTKENS